MSAIAIRETVPPELFAKVADHVAYSLAQELEEEEQIALRYQLTPGQLETLKATPAFVALVGLHRSAWEAEDNTVGRIQKKAALALERTLLPVTMIAVGSDANDANVIQASKLLKELSPLGDRTTPVGDGAGVQVQINLNGTRHELSFTAQPPIEAVE